MNTINKVLAIGCCLLAINCSAQKYGAKPDSLHKTDTLAKVKVKELGIGFTGLNAFSLQYRWGTDNMLFSISGSIAGSTSFGKGTNGSTQGGSNGATDTATGSSTTNTPINFSTGLSFSALHIKYITKKFGIMHGGIVGITYSTTTFQKTTTNTNVVYTPNANNNGTFPYNTTTNNHSQTIQPYIGLVFGAVYKINKSFLVYLSIAPNFYYAHTNGTTNTTSASLNSSNTAINTTNNTSTTNNTFGIANFTNSGAMLTLVYRITGKPKKM